MNVALHLAETGLGHVWPNPTVGCVIVNEQQLVGQGRTAKGGRPHAEVLALHAAGDDAQGATAYVTLEPCAHWGRTPPCTDALLTAGVSTVWVAMVDPDPRTNGTGIARLRGHGVQVMVGLGEERAQHINRGFCHRVRTGRPLVGVTHARGDELSTLIPRWDAVAAHPNVPLHGDDEQPTIALSGVSVVERAAWWFDNRDAQGTRHFSLPPVDSEHGRFSAMLAQLGEQGLTRLLVHADDPLASALAQAGLVDVPSVSAS